MSTRTHFTLALSLCAALPAAGQAVGRHAEVKMQAAPKVPPATLAPFVLFQTPSRQAPKSVILPALTADAPPDTPPAPPDTPPQPDAPPAPATPPAEADAPKNAVSVLVPLYYFTDAAAVLRILRPADAQPLNETAYKGALVAVQIARQDVADKEAARRVAGEALLAARQASGQTGATPPDSSALSSATQALMASQQQRDAALADAAVKEATFAKETEEWKAGIYDSSTDPLRRVYVRTAGPGLLFLRGEPQDVGKVRQALAELDRPVPQMRVTLWTVQVSGESAQGDAASRRRLASAVDQVEEDMGLLRRQLAASSDLFQQCVQKQVQQAAAPAAPAGDALPPAFGFYDPDLLARLRSKRDGSSEPEPISPVSYLHPERANSLGETLLTLLLAREDLREAALRDYLQNAPVLLAQMHADSLLRSGMKPEDVARLKLQDKYKDGIHASRLLAAFGYRVAADGSLESLAGGRTSDSVQRQQEYVLNIIRGTLQQTHRREALSHWDSLIATFRAENPKAATDPQAKALCDGVCAYFTDIANKMASGPSAQAGLAQALSDLNVTGLPAPTEPPIEITTEDQMGALRQTLEDKNTEGLAQMAVGDQIIKQFVVAVEDDLDTELIRPRLRQLQEDTSQKSIELGIVQRTSILAADRRSARVDPKASLEFSFPQPTDLLKESVDLVKLVAKGTGAGVAANLTALAGTGDAGKVLDKLSDINDHRPTPSPDVYKIETGSGFTLTPILLPDAQNMAFDLDYSLSSPVEEPQDVKGCRIARIERHGLQTYVQDGSYELRELSRFESSVKLAQPVIRTGGLPLLREIPGVRDIPILGYFSKSAGTGVGLQESLIFVHTVQYPTVKSLLALF